MKLSIQSPFIAIFVLMSVMLTAQNKKDSLGLPGDNFNLYGALELFKQAKTPEDFEKAINSNDSEINNLDLDADGKVDYVKVIDKTNDKSHSLVLQVAVSKDELQDIAVIEIEKTATDNAHVQIVGDEELYGKDYIIEPVKSETANAGIKSSTKDNANADDVYNTGGNSSTTSNAGNNNRSDNNSNNYNTDNNNYSNNNPPVVVNVWGWPSVQYMYAPMYTGWASPYYYGYYPGWWQPWQPVYYPVFYRRAYRYHQPYFYRTSFYRCNNAHNYYYGHRSTSVTVRQRTGTGYYRTQQAGYKNTGAPGRKYNSLPANSGRNVNANNNGGRGSNMSGNSQNSNTNSQRNNRERGTSNRSQGSTSTPRNSQKDASPRASSGNVNRGNSNSGNNNSQRANKQQTAPRQQQTSPQRQSSQSAQPGKSSGGGGSRGGARGTSGGQR